MINNIAKITTQELWRIFYEGLATSASGVMRAALAWRELEKRGEDMAPCRNPFTNRLTAIADGKLSAAAVLRYASAQNILNCLIGLDIDEQEKIARAEYRIPVANPKNNTVENVRPDFLTGAQIKQVFDKEKGRIRTPAEQREWLPKPAKTPIPSSPLPPQPFTRAQPAPTPQQPQQTTHKPSVAPASPPTIDAEGVWVSLTKTQLADLTKEAGLNGMSPSELIVYVLVEAGAIRNGETTTAVKGKRRGRETSSRDDWGRSMGHMPL